jgi:hypothetical protein
MEGNANYEIRWIIRFLNAMNVLPSEVHHQICQVYCDNAMSDGVTAVEAITDNFVTWVWFRKCWIFDLARPMCNELWYASHLIEMQAQQNYVIITKPAQQPSLTVSELHKQALYWASYNPPA